MSLLAALAVSAASAATCDAQLTRIGALSGDDTPGAFADLAKCDRKVAEANFNRYLERATDSDAVVGLFLAAVDTEVWNPAWGALSKITSYDARDEIAQRVGESCADRPKVVSFLQGAYFGLRDIEFQQWDDAFKACADPGLAAFVEKQVQAPPAKMFDEKFNALLDIYVKARRVAALPALTTGAIKAAKDGGPFEPMLMKMGEAVAPELGGQTTAEDQKKLEDALVSVAKQVTADQARGVANQLANSGADAAAAQLLPTLYPDRVQSGGGFLYGAVAVEAGECDGKKSAVIHFAPVSESGQRWAIASAAQGSLRATKAKLGKCTAVESPWAVLTTPEPVKTAADAEKWVESVQAEWEKKGYTVKVQKEKPVSI
ncbi:MAG: hypothetical protein Q8P18_23400 [Pseudomonadota bacterium]|nr:hypothetical protein [Pseudomonadota bacterium]